MRKSLRQPRAARHQKNKLYLAPPRGTDYPFKPIPYSNTAKVIELIKYLIAASNDYTDMQMEAVEYSLNGLTRRDIRELLRNSGFTFVTKRSLHVRQYKKVTRLESGARVHTRKADDERRTDEIVFVTSLT